MSTSLGKLSTYMDILIPQPLDLGAFCLSCVLVTFLIIVVKYLTKSIEGKKLLFGLTVGSIVHHDRERMAVGMSGG